MNLHPASPRSTPGIGAELEAALAQLSPVTPRRPRRQLASLLAVIAAYATALALVLAPRADLFDLPIAWILGGAAVWLAGTVVLCAIALVPARGTMSARWQLAARAAAVVALGSVVFGFAVHPQAESSLVLGWTRVVHGHGCLVLGFLVALAPIACALALLRRSVATGARAIAAAVGVAGGCVGALVLHLHCRVSDGPHLGLVHGGVVVISAVLTAVLAARVIDAR